MQLRLLPAILTVMKFSLYGVILQCVLVNFLSAYHTHAQQIRSVKEVHVDLNWEQATIEEAFVTIENLTDYNFNYAPSDLDPKVQFTADYQNTTVADVLINISRHAGLKFRQVNRSINVSRIKKRDQQELEIVIDEITVNGQVTTADGEGLPGVNVLVKGTTTGTVTDIEGYYNISVQEDAILSFSFIGFVTQEIAVNGRDEINITMVEDVESLEEIVVIGYGTQRKSDLTGAVASVRGEDLVKIPSVSPTQALQGKVAGVQVTSSTGAPGDAPVVRIRGIGTLNNSSPLFVVDGVFFEDITFLNSGDIESMEVLKDASATAIYGSRGANGVVLITTKKGKEGTVSVNASAEYSVQKLEQSIDLLGARDFAMVVNEILPGTFNNLDILPDVDWQSEVFDEYTPIQSYQASVSGGSEKIRYYVGGSFFDQEGLIPGSAFQRASLKINNSYELSQHITIGHNLTLGRFVRDNAPNVVATAYRAWPVDAPFAPDGSFSEVRGSSNALASLEFRNNRTTGVRTVGNFYADIKFLEHFTLRSSFGLDWEFSKNRSFTPEFFVSALQQNETSDLSLRQAENLLWVWENTLNYYREFDQHQIDALVGYTLQEEYDESLFGSVENLIREDPAVRFIDAGDQSTLDAGNNAVESSIISYLGRVNYTYAGRYLFTATLRVDGSSKFGSNNRYGVFPSFAVGWNIAEEPFMPGAGVISDLKIRGSWGQTGNEKIPQNDQFALVRTGLDAVFGADEMLQPGASLDKSSNPDLKWESTTQYDVGLEIGLLEGKLNGEFDYYNRTTEDILVELTTPGHFGNGAFVRVRTNAAEVMNQGFEFNLSWQDQIGPVNYQIGALGATLDNEVQKLAAASGSDSFISEGSLGNGQLVTRTEVGQPIGYFYGYEVVGIIQNQNDLDQLPTLTGQRIGDLRYRDINGDGKISPEDRTFIGSSIPDFLYGFNFKVSYLGIDLSADFQGQLGNELYNGKNAVRPNLQNYEGRVRDRWQGEGTSNTEPRATAGGVNFNPSTYFIEDGSFLRLRSVTLGYNFPERLISKIKLKQGRIYLRGTNVFTITDYSGYTPEIGNNNVLSSGIDLGVYPVTAVYSAGVNLSF